jgi:chemotaxis methyl-accepting protein methylase
VAVQVEQSDAIELELLLEAIHRRYGFDFRDYTADPLRRRLHRRARAENVESLSELQGSQYYVTAYDAARFNRDLIGNVVFAPHNLATDRAFAEFHLILCRNVLIYFDTPLQNRVAELFCDSLASFGVLALGSRETIAFSPVADRFAPLAERERIYRKAA